MSIAEESHEVCQLWPERSLARGCVLPFRAKVEGHLAQAQMHLEQFLQLPCDPPRIPQGTPGPVKT